MYLSLVHIFISFTGWTFTKFIQRVPYISIVHPDCTSALNRMGIRSQDEQDWSDLPLLYPCFLSVTPLQKNIAIFKFEEEKKWCKIKIKCQSQQRITYLVSFCITVDWQPGALVAYKGKKSGIHFKLKCLTDVTVFCNETDEISNS